MQIGKFLVFIVFFVGLSVLCFAQTAQEQKIREFSREDSLNMLALKKQAETFYFQNDYAQSIASAKKAIEIANKNKFEFAKPALLLLLSRNYKSRQLPEDALRYALLAEQVIRTHNITSASVEMNEQIGQIFYEQKNYNRAEYYLEIAAQQRKKENKDDKIPFLLFQKADIYVQKKELEKAKIIYEELLNIYPEHNSAQARIAVIKRLAEMYVENKQIQKALPYYNSLAIYYEEQNKIGLLIETYNNLGFLYKKNQSISESVDNFNKALELYRKYQDKVNDSEKALVSENASVAYTNLRQFKRAETLLREALKTHQKQGSQRNLAHTSNFIAANYYLNGDNLKALEMVNQAISYGTLASESEDVLASSYELLERIYKADNNTLKAQEAQKQVNLFRDKFAARQKEIAEKLKKEQEKLEKREDEIRGELIEIGRKDAELDKQRGEKELQEAQLKLQTQEFELTKQNLAVAEERARTFVEQEKAREAILQNEKLRREQIEQQLEATKQEQRIKGLEQDRRAKQFQIAQTKSEQRETKRILEDQQKQIEEEQTQRKIGIVIFSLISFMFVAAGIAFVYARRSNKALRDRNVLIKRQTDEIILRNRTMELQKQQITVQNEALGIQNTKIQQSIRAAFTIQKSLLPKEEKLKEFFREYFVIYRPKDVVSGDFYWIEKFNNYIFLVAADCTGHGVPGAFMSMIGNMLLDKIIETRQVYDPAQILQNLDQDVRSVLQQEENFDESGMDVCLCRIQPMPDESCEVVFSSAKRPFYYFDYDKKEMVENKGDRKSIGIKLKNSPDFAYSNQSMTLHTNDCIYLSSDGFTDQANATRDKFGRKNFLKIIQDHHDETMGMQGEIFEDALARHQGDSEQIDDILLMGVRL